jgi:UDP-2,3-diacylglucosamine hydrolase
LKAKPTLFVSDLHLSGGEPESAARFFRFLGETAAQGQALYILGDLFEAWVGDDDLEDPLHTTVARALHDLVALGIPIFVMHGNRDFLIGEGFCRASGAQLLPEPSVIDLFGIPTLLLHGDSLCTDDTPYQQMRTQVRNPAWQQAMLARPLEERRLIGRQLRAQSEVAKDGKSMAIMDVNAEAVAAAFVKSGCRRLIHGHTHRPAHHVHHMEGQPCERWVLPDWYTSGGYLRCDSSGCELIFLEAS